jgi:chromosomal replication initiation ATPase DnaA
LEGWLLGSSKFVERIKRQLQTPKHPDEVPIARRLKSLSIREVLDATARRYCVDAASFAAKYNRSPSRDAAAWLARRLTVATLRELAEPFGLGHPDSVRNLIRRAERAIAKSNKFRKQVQRIKQELQRP